MVQNGMAGRDIEAALLHAAALAGKGDLAVAAAVLAVRTTGCREPQDAYRAWLRYRRRMQRAACPVRRACPECATDDSPG